MTENNALTHCRLEQGSGTVWQGTLGDQRCCEPGLAAILNWADEGRAAGAAGAQMPGGMPDHIMTLCPPSPSMLVIPM